MRELRQVGVRVAVIDHLVEKLGCLPDAHLAAIQPEKLVPFLADEAESLALMIEPVKLANRWAGIGLVVAKFLFLFVRIGAGPSGGP